MKNRNPSLTFICATLNAGKYLEDWILSIKKQDYSSQLIEILISDGGSTDNTLEIAKKYNCRVIRNEKVLCEPGNDLGIKEAKGDLCVIMGADNRLVEKDWIKKMIKPFKDPEIKAAFPRIRNRPQDTWLNKYINTFTDPFNHFVYGYACNPTTFYKTYKVLKKTPDYEVYDFKESNHPILAFDQGFVLRKKGYVRPKGTEYCDQLSVIEMIKAGQKMAYVPGASNYHLTLDKGLPQFIRKQKWIISHNLMGGKPHGLAKEPFGYQARAKYISFPRKIRQYLWPFYAISFIFPALRAIFKLVTDGEKEWLYHPFINFVSAFVFWIEVVRIKILRKDPFEKERAIIKGQIY